METSKMKKQNGKPKKKGLFCEHSRECGGCQYLQVSYPKQLEKKQQELEKLLEEFGTLDPIIGMAGDGLHYRHKVNATFKRLRSGEIISGIYAKGSHHVLNVDSCLIENEQADAILCTIRQLVKQFKVSIYNEDTGRGLLRHAMVRVAEHGVHNKNNELMPPQIMVVLVTATSMFPNKKNFAKELIKKHPEITTIVQNINEKHTTMVLGTRDEIIYGKGFIEDSLCGKVFRLSPQSFYQVNPLQAEILYNKAIEFAELTGTEMVIDAYCGTGTIGIVASDYAKQVVGVELNQDAVADAIKNAKRNEATNVRFYNQDAGKFMVNLARQGKKADVVILDPPRSGSTNEFLDALTVLKPEKVVYVSCGPESLKRDLKYLTTTCGYEVKRMVGVDLFGFTSHVETVCLLSRKASV